MLKKYTQKHLEYSKICIDINPDSSEMPLLKGMLSIQQYPCAPFSYRAISCELVKGDTTRDYSESYVNRNTTFLMMQKKVKHLQKTAIIGGIVLSDLWKIYW
ncbi:MAG: hypothetical protein GF411_16965 [Candidatus Lokiarchaeota archaeon]|nr:hypothetical protein [Candidatus Lokiarchaeota archaeon]